MNCEYQTYRNGKLRDCGQPATHRGLQPPKRFYCTACNAIVSQRGGLKTAPLKRTADVPVRSNVNPPTA